MCIVVDPDPRSGPAEPEPDPFQPKVKLNYTFFQKISIKCPKILNYDTYDAKR
jgi:hypothetical protein